MNPDSENRQTWNSQFCSRRQWMFTVNFTAIIGLLISYLVSWIFGAQTLPKTMRNGISTADAAFAGAKIAAMIAGITIVVTRFLRSQESVDPNSFSQFGGGEYVRSIDGIPTPYGWQVLALQTITFILLGAIVTLIVRLVIGSGEALWKD